MFRHLKVRASHEYSPVAASTATAPHLLAVDDEAVAISFSFRTEGSEVTSCTRLREQLAPHMLCIQGGEKVLFLLFVSTESHDGAARKNETHHIENRWNASFGTFLHPGTVMCGGETLTAEFDRPMNTGKASIKDVSLPCCAIID
jgi:hypothetical protein